MKAYISRKWITQVIPAATATRGIRGARADDSPAPAEELEPLSRSLDAPGLAIEEETFYNPYDTQVMERPDLGNEEADDPYNNTGCYKLGEVWRGSR